MEKRQETIIEQLQQTDGTVPNAANPSQKHQKMAQNPFRFLRGSAPLFYHDLAEKELLPKALLLEIPLCMIQGDCHASNFGFFTEEGSHGNALIFGLNDFDDACVGHAAWDLLRFATSLYLAQSALAIQAKNKSDSAFNAKYLPSLNTTRKSVKAFLHSYIKTCQKSCKQKSKRHQYYDRAITHFTKDHILNKSWQKAVKRCAGGKQFLTKSALAKATQWTDQHIFFAPNNPKFSPVSEAERNDLLYHFEPFFDDTALDVVERLDAGTGSVNMQRFYFLVGPKSARYPRDLALCHIVEVKKQRAAAPLSAFPTLNPTNRLNPAHLTQICQQRMQRAPDLVLDETYWQGEHWLIRSRHHAKVGIEPADLVNAPNKSGDAGIKQYAQLCGHALALAHMRSDRRSGAFERAISEHLPKYKGAISQAAQEYATQTHSDWKILQELIATKGANTREKVPLTPAPKEAKLSPAKLKTLGKK